MADISITHGQTHQLINSQSQTSINNHTNIKAVNAPTKQADDSKSDIERKEKLRDELLENVVSVSEDGDTVQVSDDGADKLNKELFDNKPYDSYDTDESYIPGTSKHEVNIEISSKMNTDNIEISPVLSGQDNRQQEISSDNSSNVTSFAGYTDSQLEQMYIKGDITKFDYDQEIESREAQREELKNDNQDASEQIMATINGMERVAQDADQIDIAFSDNSAEKPDAAQRIEILSTLQDLTK